MKRLLLALLATPAFAADLPIKTLGPAPIVAAYNPFYLGLEGGMGFTREENVISAQGIAVGTPKLYPTAPSIGVALGYINNTGPLAIGAELYGDYNFSAQDLNCVAGICTAKARNSLSAGADILVGFTLGQMIAVTPSSAQPQNWKVPVTVPSSIMNNLQLLGSVGAAGKQASLCAMDLVTAQELCGSEWMGGLSVGGQIRFLAAAQWDVAVKYHHNFYNHTFTPTQSIPVFSNSVTAKGEDTFKVGFNYHL